MQFPVLTVLVWTGGTVLVWTGGPTAVEGCPCAVAGPYSSGLDRGTNNLVLS